MPASPDRRRSVLGRIVRAGWLALGCVFVALGIIGALLPLMPTTVFLILAAACFARSSPRLEAWLLDRPRFGPVLRAWRRDGAIAPRAKLLACTGMAAGFALFCWRTQPGWPLATAVGMALAACAIYVVGRPRAQTSDRGAPDDRRTPHEGTGLGGN